METMNSQQPVLDQQAQQDIADNKVLAAVGYLGILCLVPLLLKRDSKFAQFHGKQGLVLCIAWVANFFIGIVPILGWIASGIGTIVLIVLTLLGIIKALAGEYWEMPYLAEYAKGLKI